MKISNDDAQLLSRAAHAFADECARHAGMVKLPPEARAETVAKITRLRELARSLDTEAHAAIKKDDVP